MPTGETLEIPVFNKAIEARSQVNLSLVQTPARLPVEKALKGFCRGKTARAIPANECTVGSPESKRGLLRTTHYIAIAPRTSKELQKLTGLAEFTIRRHLETLQAEGLIDVIGKRVEGSAGPGAFLWGWKVKLL